MFERAGRHFLITFENALKLNFLYYSLAIYLIDKGVRTDHPVAHKPREIQ